MAETKYSIKIYNESPLGNGDGETSFTFDTSPLASQNDMVFTMSFNNSVRYTDRMRI